MDGTRPGEMVELYRGPFLDGFHGAGGRSWEQWVEDERIRCREEAAAARSNRALWPVRQLDACASSPIYLSMRILLLGWATTG